MAHFAFAISPTSVYSGAAHVAARDAVLWPLCPPRSPPDPEAAESFNRIVDSYERLRVRWQQRVIALRAAGWSALADVDDDARRAEREDGKLPAMGHNAQYMANCPPFGVVPSVKARACNRTRVCPMCHARRVVVEAYRSMHFALYHAVADRADRARLRLFMVRQTFDRLSLTEKGGIAGRAARVTRKARFDDHRRMLAGGCRVLAARSGFTMEPGTDPGTLKVTRAYLAALPEEDAHAAPLAGPTVGHGGYDVAEVSKGNLAAAVAWCFPYPRGMMAGDAKVAVQILETTASDRAKFSATFGAANNAAIRNAVRAACPSTGEDDDNDMPMEYDDDGE